MDFPTWKNLGPVKEIAARMGFEEDLSKATTWDDYTSRFIRANDNNGRMVNAAQSLWGYLSRGERPVLAAMLHAADFSRFSDKFSDGGIWRDLDHTYGKHAAAVAIAILRQ